MCCICARFRVLFGYCMLFLRLELTYNMCLWLIVLIILYYIFIHSTKRYPVLRCCSAVCFSCGSTKRLFHVIGLQLHLRIDISICDTESLSNIMKVEAHTEFSACSPTESRRETKESQAITPPSVNTKWHHHSAVHLSIPENLS